MTRNQSIDTFRGLAIIGMVFFTLTLKLSSDLPELLKHNSYDSLHIGDFVLPMFLFASGMSIAFFIKKREVMNKKDFKVDILRRFFRLVLIGIILSPFSANGFFEMDEVMLCAILFIACILLVKIDWKLLIFLIFLINFSYYALNEFYEISFFQEHYLGGYPATLYYFPVMLIGFIVGKELIAKDIFSKKNLIIMSIIVIFFFISWIIIPIKKLEASPSFMMLSILFSFIIFAVVDKMVKTKRFKEIEYLGKKPIRYWLMMYIIFIIPAHFYIETNNKDFPLNIQWQFGILISLGLIILLWGISKVIDR